MTDPGFENSTLRPEQLPEEFGRYRILHLLGVGGMGAVYRAWDPSLKREVALKVPTGFCVGNGEAWERFQREARAAAALDHPGICRVYDVGECNGLPYFTLQFIRGETLADLLRREEKLVPRRVAELCLAMAEAVRHAHENGIVHRDLKPANVMLDWAGNPRLMDFGLSRRITEDSSLTGQGQLLGTPAYMSPEQALGETQLTGPATDIFSLGIILYEMLTGRRPFPGKGNKVLIEILQDDPPPPSRLRPELDRRLDAVCMRALEKQIGDRYASMAEFADALRSVLADSPEKPEPVPRRRKLAATATVVVLAALAVVAVSGLRGTRNDAPPELAATSGGGAVQQESPAADAIAADTGEQEGEESRGSSPPASLSDPVSPLPSLPSRARSEAASAADGQELAAQAVAILKEYCHRCHGIDFAAPGLDVLDHALLVAVQEDDPSYVLPGDPEASLLWERIGIDRDMPPEGSPQPSESEREQLRAWIAAGAPLLRSEERPYVAWNSELAAIRDHLRRNAPPDRRHQRYFTFTNLHNDPRVSEEELKQARAALSKALASLSWQPEIVVPEQISTEQTVAVMDVRDLGWDAEKDWNAITRLYPYGLTFSYSGDPSLRELGPQIAELSGTDLPYVRADWFIATATRPPLYEQLLGLPEHDAVLEQRLQVDVRKDFIEGRLVRAGFSTSGVSGQNRMVDRHRSVHGGYWKSYDFRSNDGRGNLFKFPLGPAFPGHPFPDQTFEHDGGEIIFTLPNGLHGYYLSDERGHWIEAGPVEVVSDALKTAGTPAIVNGLSCMACHKDGIIDLEDRLRNGAGVFGDAQKKVEQICPEPETLQSLVRRDRAAYLDALRQAVGPFYDMPEATHAELRSLPEPVSAVARRYQRDLDLADVANELGLADVESFRGRLQTSGEFRRLGLAPLLDGGKIKRASWSSLETLTSLFQETAQKSQIGTPYLSH